MYIIHIEEGKIKMITDTFQKIETDTKIVKYFKVS